MTPKAVDETSSNKEAEQRRTPSREASEGVGPWPAASTITLQNQNDFETFPEFPQQNIDAEVMSSATMDDTMSITTNASDDDQQFVVFETPDDDVFNNATDVVVGEEATEIDECLKSEQQHQAILSKRVNVLSVLLDNVNMTILSVNKSTSVEGYSSKVDLNERMDQTCGEVFSWINAQTNAQHSSEITHANGSYQMAQVKFRFISEANNGTPSLNAQVQGVNIKLNEEIVSHLSPFLFDEDKIETPLNMKINVSETNIFIKDAKTAYPLRIKLNDCVIEQGDEESCC
ncbi:unnamed protein product [Anisakis simplex]|uniref:PITH domain-containing protein n=1 Tax=Anisakis simplex TaxID=6269 RepID=A0A0M3JZ65_ANISI|nr:unnamed protein product [Anisakis simplex]